MDDNAWSSIPWNQLFTHYSSWMINDDNDGFDFDFFVCLFTGEYMYNV